MLPRSEWPTLREIEGDAHLTAHVGGGWHDHVRYGYLATSLPGGCIDCIEEVPAVAEMPWDEWLGTAIRAVAEARFSLSDLARLTDKHEQSDEPTLSRVVTELRAEVASLRARVVALEASADPAIVEDPFLAWCEHHREELARFPNSHVAISLDRGIVATSESAEEFARKLSDLEKAGVRDLFLTHSSLFA